MLTSVSKPDELGVLVRDTRLIQGLTQKELAGLLPGFDKETIASLESGESTVELGKVLAVLNALGLNIAIAYDGAFANGAKQ